jgi:hypothetical protein
MRRERPIKKLNSLQTTRPLVALAAISVFFHASANAVQPPSEQCRATSKVEYNSAKKQHLLRKVRLLSQEWADMAATVLVLSVIAAGSQLTFACV